MQPFEKSYDKVYKVDNLPIYNYSTDKRDYVKIYPTAGCKLDGDINFDYPIDNEWLIPNDSYIILEGKLTKNNGNDLLLSEAVKTNLVANTKEYVGPTLTNNSPMFLFSWATYLINGQKIEDVKDPGRASLMKGIVTYSTNLNK